MKNKIMNILKKINYIKTYIVLLYIIVAQLLWHSRGYVIDYMVSKATTELQIKMVNAVVNIGLTTILSIILVALIITLKRYNKAKEEEQKNAQDVGLKNESGEFIELVDILEGNNENEFTYVIDPKNISVEKLRKRQDDLERIYHIKIDYIESRIPTKYVNVHCTPWELLKPTLFEVNINDHFLDDFLSALVVGSTGSGKTYFGHQLLGKIVLNKYNKKEDVEVFICDRKNEDYIQFKNCPNYYGINAIDGIRKVHEIFEERLNNDESNENKKTIICLIEEYALLLNSLSSDKKTQDEIKNKVADLMFAGRSKKIITIVSLQRADAEYFPRGAKEQFKNIIMMGNISEIQLNMLLDEEHKKQVTENNPQGYGYLYEYGNRKLTRIKVAEISQEKLDALDTFISRRMG